MSRSLFRAANSLLQTISFQGLSGEQALLATLVSQNPATDERVRSRARVLLQLDEGATPEEAARSEGRGHKSVVDLIQRFCSGGLCEALLGSHASREDCVWLSLSPSSPPRVQLKEPAGSVGQGFENPRSSLATPARSRAAQPPSWHISSTRHTDLRPGLSRRRATAPSS